MATLNEIKTALNYTDTYAYEGRLFRDRKRNTATLYLEIVDALRGTRTPEIRIGFEQFDRSDDQTQTQTIVRSSGKTVQGLEVRIFVPSQDSSTYQLDFNLNGERHTAHWHCEQNKNLVATSASRAIPIEELFKTQHISSQKLRTFLNQYGGE